MILQAYSTDDLVLLREKRRRRDRSRQAEFIARYQYDPALYIADHFGWSPWDGSGDAPGQSEIIAAYVLALRQQHEKHAYEAGEAPDLRYWQPGEPIKNTIRIEAGHTVGKTKIAAALVNHFFDCFVPSIVYTFAPSWEQIHDLLWKEIKADRRDRGLPGRILDLELQRSDNHFAKGRATNNAGGMGSERAQGQHGKYLMFVLDEAEGVADFVYDAVDAMTSGGISIVLMLANPRTRSSRFHKAAGFAEVTNFRISCIQHPNVVQGREIVPGAVQRQYVEKMIEKHCEVAEQHDEDAHTFEVPWQPGIIYRPNPEFMWRVLGVAPLDISDNTFVPIGRYEAAKKRPAPSQSPYMARFGVDVARYGKDMGTLYMRYDGYVRKLRQFAQLDTNVYAQIIKEEALKLPARGVTSLHIRIDAGGGYGGGVADKLKIDSELMWAFPDFQVIEVHFNGIPNDAEAYVDLAAEMYGETAEALRVVALLNPPDALEGDLCDRVYRWVTHKGIAVRRLETKDEFKKRMRRSPDDGDGCVLAIAPDHLFKTNQGWNKDKLQTLSSGRRV